jgi:hypothetical protein
MRSVHLLSVDDERIHRDNIDNVAALAAGNAVSRINFNSELVEQTAVTFIDIRRHNDMSMSMLTCD